MFGNAQIVSTKSYKYSHSNVYLCEKVSVCEKRRLKNDSIFKLIMEKDILIQSLKDRVGEDNCKSISDKTFEAMADVYLPLFANDDAVTDDTWKMPVASLIQFAGQKRHDEKVFAENLNKQHKKDVDEKVRVAVEKAIEEYKASQPKEDPKQEEPAESDDVDAKISAAVAKALAQLTGDDGAIGKLSNTLNGFIKTQTEREKTEEKSRVKAGLKQFLKSLKADNEACIDDALDDIDYGDAPTVEGLKDAVKTAYEKRYKRYYSNGGKPFGGESTSGEGGMTSMMDAHIKRVEAQVKDAQDYASSIEFAK